jgi:hypothetical protein
VTAALTSLATSYTVAMGQPVTTDMMGRDMVSARTILVIGEIAAHLQVDQDSSRARFTAVFERFARRPVQRRTSRLAQIWAEPARAGATLSVAALL